MTGCRGRDQAGARLRVAEGRVLVPVGLKIHAAGQGGRGHFKQSLFSPQVLFCLQQQTKLGKPMVVNNILRIPT